MSDIWYFSVKYADMSEQVSHRCVTWRDLTPNRPNGIIRPLPGTRPPAPMGRIGHSTHSGANGTSRSNAAQGTNTSFQSKGGEPTQMEQMVQMVTKPTTSTTADSSDVQDNPVEVSEKVESTQLTAIEIKLVNTAELLKAHAETISVNVRNARERSDKLNGGVMPLTTFCVNAGILDDADNRDKTLIADMQDALDKADMPVNMSELAELAHLVANVLKTPDLSNLDDPDVKGEADKLRDVLKAAEYLDAGESIINTAKLAIGVYDASMTSLRDWNNKGKSTKTGNSPGPTSMPFSRDNVDMASKLRSTDKVSKVTGWDVEYVCGDTRTKHGDALGSVKHYIRAAYREANNLDETAGSAGTPEWADLGPAITKALTTGENVEWGNGYIHRVSPGS